MHFSCKYLWWYDYTRREHLLSSNLLFFCKVHDYIHDTQSITIKWEGKIYANYSFFLVSLFLLLYRYVSVQISKLCICWSLRKNTKMYIYLCTNTRMYLKVYFIATFLVKVIWCKQAAYQVLNIFFCCTEERDS